MVGIEYSEAITEVLDILEHTRKEDIEKIPSKFIDYLKENASKSYKPELDHTKKIEDMQLKIKTKAILAIIYIKFWCDSEKKKEVNNILKNNEIEYQKQLKEKYNPDNFFKKQDKVKNTKDVIAEEVSMIEYKESIFKRFINKIKSIF